VRLKSYASFDCLFMSPELLVYMRLRIWMLEGLFIMGGKFVRFD
jgi:hypothetical protein